jgi:hypothetical protein
MVIFSGQHAPLGGEGFTFGVVFNCKSRPTRPMVRTDDSRFLPQDLVFIGSRWPPHIGRR